ncbi:MAG TPA: hypothetical protein VMW53_01375 [archaeon]|nr:hypothetical protein [archaeon]
MENNITIKRWLEMMFPCKICGYKYNISISYIKNKCQICGSVPIKLFEPSNAGNVNLSTPQ